MKGETRRIRLTVNNNICHRNVVCSEIDTTNTFHIYCLFDSAAGNRPITVPVRAPLQSGNRTLFRNSSNCCRMSTPQRAESVKIPGRIGMHSNAMAKLFTPKMFANSHNQQRLMYVYRQLMSVDIFRSKFIFYRLFGMSIFDIFVVVDFVGLTKWFWKPLN